MLNAEPMIFKTGKYTALMSCAGANLIDKGWYA